MIKSDKTDYYAIIDLADGTQQGYYLFTENTNNMDTLRENPARIGKFTSSLIGKLMTVSKDRKSFGAPALEYIEERIMEIRLGRPLVNEQSSHPTTWGNLCEKRAFDLLGVTYKECSQETIVNPNLDCHAGSPDGLKYEGDKVVAVIDIKSPFTLKSFCTFANCKTIEEVRENHKEGDTYYYQLVSNAILTNTNKAELIIYCPYLEELEIIREMARSTEEGLQSKFAWINFEQDEAMPYLLPNGYYKNLHIIQFDIPNEEKLRLIGKIQEANDLLKSMM